MEYEFLVDNTSCKISIKKKDGIFILSQGDEVQKADIQYISPNIISILIDNRSTTVYFARDRELCYLFINGQQFVVKEPSGEGESFQIGETDSQEDKKNVRSPMPGKVIKVNVVEKEKVRKNQTLAIVEAMKMENEIKSSMEGRIKKIFVSPGDLVDVEKTLIELESE